MILRLIATSLLSMPLCAQSWGIVDPCPAGLEIVSLSSSFPATELTPPKVTHKVEPKFTAEAQRARVAPGLVLLQIVVGANGRACDIRVISSMGFGLDESAIAAIQQWRFTPATRSQLPIAVRATVEVNFVYQGYGVDGDEIKRAQFNRAVDSMRSQFPKDREFALAQIKALSQKKYPPADGLLALYSFLGDYIPQDIPQALFLAQRANKKNDRVGIYALGYAYESGLGVEKDEAKAFSLYSEASTLGLNLAQIRVARAYATGKPVPKDMQRAERTYRLCATQGTGVCAYELAVLLKAQSKSDLAEVAAWALIAQDLGIKESKDLLSDIPESILKEARALQLAILQAKRSL